MSAAGDYRDLRRLGRPLLTTAEARAVWQTTRRTAGRRLETLAEAGLVRHLRRGLWALDPEVAPFAIAPFLTAPFPAYVSFWSALSRHQMIEQIPRQISVASLDRTKRIKTTLGDFEIHHLAPELFGGYGGTEQEGYVASPEKALFDSVYVRSASGAKAYFPELSFPEDFDSRKVEEWVGRIGAPRLRTLVSRRLGEVVSVAA